MLPLAAERREPYIQSMNRPTPNRRHPIFHARMRAAAACAATVIALSGCAMIPGYREALNPSTTDPSHSATATSDRDKAIDAAKEYDAVGNPVRVSKGATVAIHLDRSHPSVGHGYEIVGDPNAAVVAAEVEHVSDNENPEPGGDRGASYLLLEGKSLGTAKVAVVYCWRDEPDAAGKCDQDGARYGDRMLEHEFTVEVK